VLIEESRLGWKEFEMEVVRDKADNCIIICSIENIDAWGCIPATASPRPRLTLTDKGISAHSLGLDRLLRRSGGNRRLHVQFRGQPQDGRMVVIEMNRGCRAPRRWPPRHRLSHRQIAAKLACGYTLDDCRTTSPR